MKFSLTSRELHPRRAFRIARPRRNPVCNVYLRVEGEGITGWGEASPNAYYGEDVASIMEKVTAAGDFIADLHPESAEDIAEAWERSWPLLYPSRAAQCALDLALWDWLARARGRSVAQLVWGEAPLPVPTFCTIGLSTPEELTEKVAEVRGFPRVKIKSDRAADLAAVRAVREQTSALLAVDANAAWDLQRLPALACELAALGVEFVEQPLAPAQDAELVRGAYALPLVADESCVVEEDIDRMEAHFDGFNIKLVKCGGLTPGLRMLRRGRALGCRVMVGCMLESSLLIAAGATLAQRSDDADLDGAWLLADDPFRGLGFEQGRLMPEPGALGFGVEPEAGLF
jgi:L-alanine-DL-glutamate epimerase-like enolase superfamily enzyme